MGVVLDDESLTGTSNFFKASEGYMEAYPQAVYQLSITLRDKWPPSNFEKWTIIITKYVSLFHVLSYLTTTN